MTDQLLNQISHMRSLAPAGWQAGWLQSIPQASLNRERRARRARAVLVASAADVIGRAL